MSGSWRGCRECGGVLLGRQRALCRSCARTRRHPSNPLYGSARWKATVRAVLARDGHRCQHCGATERLVVDHKTPWDRYPGSFFEQRNLWVLCSAHNNSKRDLSVEEWHAALARRRPASAVVRADYTRPAPGRSIFGGRRR